MHDQVAHVVAGVKTTPLNFVPSLAMSGFSFDKLAARASDTRVTCDPPSLIAALRSWVDVHTQPGKAYLGEVVVHGEDIRRVVGVPPVITRESHLSDRGRATTAAPADRSAGKKARRRDCGCRPPTSSGRPDPDPRRRARWCCWSWRFPAGASRPSSSRARVSISLLPVCSYPGVARG